MKKVLILGGSHRDIPLIKAAQELGFFVITLGDREYYLGHKYSDKSYKVNFNDLDSVRKIVQKEEIAYLLPGSGEESYLNTVKIAHEFKIGNFDSLETASMLHNKWKFKEFCLKNNICTPKGKLYKEDQNLANLSFPIVVKPSNLSGGRGVKVVKTKEQLQESLSYAKALSDEIFLEEYIEGKLIAYSIFLVNQKIVYGFLGEDVAFLNPYLITTAFPTRLKQNTLNRLKDGIHKIASLLNLVNGMFHLQVIIKDDQPYIIDITRRIPGDLYPYLIEYCDGVKYSQAVVKSYCDGKIDDEFVVKNKTQKFVVRHVLMPKENGVYKKNRVNTRLKNNIVYSLQLLEENSKIYNCLNTQIAIYFLKIDKELLSNINDFFEVEIQK